ncbi:FAD-binding oxidoreductase [Streptomyces sp. NRRL S-31]|uniref:FAD-binding oxidoreductase n=1 Tax=Streptomyces sp. NRRL S-31 TaxID=1463898 RepID=UPI0004C7BA8C|nr:FAD-binding protein [Streptomyces sp. NRRL S-31]AZM68348.1 FAD OX/berberine bridge protein [Streptomyces sp.]
MLNRRNFIRVGGGVALGGVAAGAVPTLTYGADSGFSTLAARLQGDLVQSGDTGYDQAKQLMMMQWDAAAPQAIAYCETAADVQKSVLFARERGIPVRTRSGGHSYAGWSTGPGLVIDVSRINHATVSGSNVRMGPGTQSVNGITALAPLGKQIATGTCPTVCPGGFFSGGGYGYATRKFGLGSDRVAAASVVLADGSLVRASATQNSDLFWALRGGGGGNFGIVVDFEVRPISAPTMVYYETWWDYADVAALFGAWQDWIGSGSDNLGSQFILMLPDAAAGQQPLVLITGGYLGPKSELDTALAQLASLSGARPQDSNAVEGSYADGMKHVYHCDSFTVQQCQRTGTNPDAALPRVGWQRETYRLFNTRLGAADNARLLGAWDSQRAAGHTRYLHCMALGGAANRVSRTSTAYWHRDATFVAGFVDQLPTAAPPAEDQAVAESWTDNAAAVLDPLSSGAYVNFTSSRLSDWQHRYYGDNYGRLTTVKRAYDPTNFFQHGRSIEVG